MEQLEQELEERGSITVECVLQRTIVILLMSAPRALALPNNVDHRDTETTAAHLSSISTPSPSLKADYGVGLHRQTRQQRHCDPEYSDNDEDDLSDGDTDSSCSGDDDNDEVVQYHKQRHRGRQRERTEEEQQPYEDDHDDAVLAETTAVVGGDSADLESSSLFTAAAAISGCTRCTAC